MRLGIWSIALFLTGCATGLRDDLGLRRDIERMGLTKMPVATARARLSEQKFVCEKDYQRYADAPHISVECTRAVAGIACKDNEHVSLEYRPESGLVDRVTTRRANNCL